MDYVMSSGSTISNSPHFSKKNLEHSYSRRNQQARDRHHVIFVGFQVPFEDGNSERPDKLSRRKRSPRASLESPPQSALGIFEMNSAQSELIR